jgi:hypothetical protein
VRKRCFLELNLLSHVLAVQVTLLQHSLASLGLRDLTGLNVLGVVAARHSRPVLLPHKFAVVLDALNLITRLVGLALSLLQLLEDDGVRMALIELVQLGFVGLRLLLLRQLVLQSHPFSLVAAVLVFFFELVQFLQVDGLVGLLNLGFECA